MLTIVCSQFLVRFVIILVKFLLVRRQNSWYWIVLQKNRYTLKTMTTTWILETVIFCWTMRRL